MRKSTFNGLAVFCGLGTLFLGFVLWLVFFDVSSGSSKSMRVEQDFLSIGSALKIYQINAGRPPTTAQGLEALVSEPRTSPKPKAWVQVMKMVPADPWGTPYRYALLGPREREWRWELRCAGPDRVFGNRDDLTGEEESGDYLVLQNERAESRPSY